MCLQKSTKQTYSFLPTKKRKQIDQIVKHLQLQIVVKYLRLVIIKVIDIPKYE